MAETRVGYGPLARIDGPLPIPPVYGILPAAAAPAAGVTIVTDVDGSGREQWINGAQVFPFPSGVAHVWDACAVGTDKDTAKDTGSLVQPPQFGAFTVYFGATCTAYAIWDQDEYKARAVKSFTAVESAGVASEFMFGTKMLLNPHLSDGNGVFPNANTATGIKHGLALLEREIAKTGKFGLIHCTPMAADFLKESFAIDDRTGVIRTINGNVVIPDAGYVIGVTPPKGHPAATGTQEWMYASGPMELRRSEVFVTPENVAQAVDRGTGGASGTVGANSVTYYVERYYLADWDTALQAAVLVDWCGTTCVGST